MQKKKNEYVYQLVTADRYEYPYASADTLEELSKHVKLSKSALAMALERKSIIAGHLKIVKVYIGDVNFDFDDYKRFCKTENLKLGHATSLQKFREYVGADYDCGL